MSEKQLLSHHLCGFRKQETENPSQCTPIPKRSREHKNIGQYLRSVWKHQEQCRELFPERLPGGVTHGQTRALSTAGL